METSNNWIIFDGKVVPEDHPVVPVVSRGLMYGDGIFETFRTYEGQSFCLKEHLDRLHSGMRILGIDVNPKLQIGTLQKMVFRLLEKQQLLRRDAIVRLQVWRDGQRGYHPQEESITHFSIMASACPDEFLLPVLKTVNRKRIPSQSMPPDVKFTNGINYILAAQEAAKEGGDDALMQTVDGFISETTIANIFWIKDHKIFTPDKECDLIPGITRKVIMDIIRESNRWKIEVGKYLLDHILDADAVWLCNSVREVLPVKNINRQAYDVDHTAIQKLQTSYIQRCRSKKKPLKS